MHARQAISPLPAHVDVDWSLEKVILSGYSLVSRQLLEKRALLKRVDTKFLFSRRHLPDILSSLSATHGLLAPPGAVWQEYRSDYFDTEDLAMYHDHRRGRWFRHKVRLRHYLDRNQSYLEVKRRRRPGLTAKTRREVPFLCRRLTQGDRAFIEQAIAPARMRLELKLMTRYRRVTLIGLHRMERVTFDLGLEVATDDRSIRFDKAVIAEVKQERFSAASEAMSALRSCGIRPSRASKYCIGTMVLSGDVRSNRLKPSLRNMMGVNHD